MARRGFAAIARLRASIWSARIIWSFVDFSSKPSSRQGVPRSRRTLAQLGPLVVTMGPMIRVELARIEALELLGMTLAHLNDAEAKAETSPRLPLLMAIRDKLALGLREEL